MQQCRMPQRRNATVQKATAQKSRCVEMGNVTTVYEDLTYVYVYIHMYRNVYVTMSIHMYM